MRTHRQLDTGWTFAPVAPALDSPAALLWNPLPAVVPGVVHTDLLRAGFIADPYLNTNEADLNWIGRTTWRYSCVFEMTLDDAESHDLVFDGLDTVATVTLNGVELAQTRNQHRSYRFDVTTLLRDGENTVSVQFEPARAAAEELERQLGPLPNVYPAPFNFIRKSACNFGWDWGPDLETAGIWRSVRIESGDSRRIDSVRVAVSVIDGVPRTVAHVAVVAAQDESLSISGVLAGVHLSTPVVDGVAQLTFDTPGAAMWWPRGFGDQTLHDLSIELTCSEGVVDTASRRVGFRHVELDTSRDGDETKFTFLVNGVPIFIRGANWIPDDCFPSRITPERYRERIAQAIDANINLLRVWGGGIYEAEAFYDECDRLGILVWQDFLFACAAYPEEEPIRGEVIAEAKENIVRLSSHASLVLWCGSNENIMGWFDWPWQDAIGERTWGAGYYLDVLPGLVAEFAPTTPYWASSPYSGSMEVPANDPGHATIHIWDVWNEVDWRHYADYSPRFVSEFGFQGPPTWSTLTAAIADLSVESPAMRSHQKAENGDAKLAGGLRPHLPEPRTTEEWHFATQLNQARAITFAIERFRSQRPHCMGTIVWQLNDCWPVISWSAIDGNGRRKPLWHALRRAYADVLTTLQQTEGGVALCVVNDSCQTLRMTATARRIDIDGTVHARERIEITVPALSVHSEPLPSHLTTPKATDRELLVVDADGGRRSVYSFVEDLNLALKPVDVHVAMGEQTGEGQTVLLTASETARGVTLLTDVVDPNAWVDMADLTIFPGETVEVMLHSASPFTPELLAAVPVRTVNALHAPLPDALS